MNPKAIQCNRTGRIASPTNPPSPPQDPTVSQSLSFAKPSVICTTGSMFGQDDKTVIQPLQPAINQSVTSPRAVNQSATSPASSPGSERSAYKRPYTVSALLDLPQFSPCSPSKEIRKISRSESPLFDKEAAEMCDEILQAKRPRSELSEKLISRLLTLHDNVNKLRKGDYEPSESLLDILTRPCAMDEMAEFSNPRQENDLDASDLLNIDIALAVEYAKSFDVFKNMPLEDKCFLLRDVTLVLSLFENAYRSFLRKNSLSAFESIVKIEQCETPMEMSSPIQLATESLVRAELDRSQFVLLKAVVFLHAECFGLSSLSYKQLVEKRQLVLDALFDYMMSTYGKQGPVKYGNVLSVSWTLFKAAQRYKESIEKLDLEPLSEEILSNKLPSRLV